jgi:hypothetical protein
MTMLLKTMKRRMMQTVMTDDNLPMMMTTSMTTSMKTMMIQEAVAIRGGRRGCRVLG